MEKQFDEELMLAVLSGQRSKDKDAPSRVRIRPIELKGSVCYQASSTVGTKVLHSNHTKEEIISYVTANLGEGCFSQLQTQGRCVDGTVLVSKKGRQTIKVKKHPTLEPVRIQAHNRVKQYILKEGTAVPFLVDLGVMNREGKIHNTSYDKFKQINRFLEFIEDILPALSREREITILDFGCGKSYLTFAMYYYLKELKGYDVNIIGLDLKEDVIKKCNGLAGKYGYDKLHFLHGDIADYAGVQCCQHELNSQIHNELLEPVLKYGILKERISALLTDGIRAELLESQGYSTQILEFIDMEHTPKNLLIRAVKNEKAHFPKGLPAMNDALNSHLTLEKLLYPDGLHSEKGV